MKGRVAGGRPELKLPTHRAPLTLGAYAVDADWRPHSLAAIIGLTQERHVVAADEGIG